jgi:hypothetical protein
MNMTVNITGIMYAMTFACGCGGAARRPIHDNRNIDAPITSGVI